MHLGSYQRNEATELIAICDLIEERAQRCLGRSETISPVEDGVEMMKILCAIYESSRTGKEIIFD